jgi:tetrahedral aminopeptidase
MKEMLKKLVDASGVTGNENGIRNIMKKELEKSCDSIEVNKMGNLIAKKGSGKLKIMIAAHMDEIGLMIKHITEKGFLRFEPLGGVDQRTLLAQKVRVFTENGEIVGVIGSKPIHIQEKEEREQVIKMKNLFIDVGAKDRKDAEKMGIRIGDFVGIYREFSELKNGFVTGNGFDNRAGCAALIEIMKRLKPKGCTIYAVGTVQEEKGLIGARGAVFQINPEVMIAVDTTIAGDTPEIGESEAPVRLGEGPVLVMMDGYNVMNPQVKKWLTETAEKSKISYQRELSPGSGMDSSIASIVREGIPAAGISVPTRYVHTGVEVLNFKDLESVADFVVAAINSIDKYF